MNLVKTFAPFGHPSHLDPSQRLYKDISCPLIPADMARGQGKPNIKKNGRQPPALKNQGGVLGVHTACLSWPSVGKQPQGISKQQAVRKSARLQAIRPRKQSRSRNPKTAFPTTHKQHPCRPKSMFLHPFLCYVRPLTWLRPHNVHRSSKNPQSHIGNGKESTKLDVPLLKTETGLLRSDREPRLQAALLRKNYIRRRQATPARAVLTLSSIGFRTEGSVRSTSNKTARSGKISKGVSLRKCSNKGIGYKSITWKSRLDQCTVFTTYNICLRGRGPLLPFTARIRNPAFRHPAINCRGKLKALNTGL